MNSLKYLAHSVLRLIQLWELFGSPTCSALKLFGFQPVRLSAYSALSLFGSQTIRQTIPVLKL